MAMARATRQMSTASTAKGRTQLAIVAPRVMTFL
jgi:hypothetical protein